MKSHLETNSFISFLLSGVPVYRTEYFRTYDKTEKEVNDRINLLYKKNLRSVRYTGTPESRKEINELVSRWDFISATLYGHYPKEVEDDMFCSHQEGLDITIHNVFPLLLYCYAIFSI
jgi:hypothetical protein